MPALRIRTPAKINLTLEVLGKRADGYHTVRSVMQAVRLCDNLDFEPAEQLSFSCDLPGWEAGKSLVSRAAALLRSEYTFSGGAGVRIEKHIPLSSGLGGDSSDGAAVLLGLNSLWQLNLSGERLRELAAGLGSDVPFFLTGGTALAEGRGERVSILPPLEKLWLVIMIPPIGVPGDKTSAMYARLRPHDFTDGRYTDVLLEDLARGAGVRADQLYNIFEGIAYSLFPGLFLYRRALMSAGAERVHLAGAGPVLFSLHRSRLEAEGVSRRLSGWPVVVADTLASSEEC